LRPWALRTISRLIDAQPALGDHGTLQRTRRRLEFAFLRTLNYEYDRASTRLSPGQCRLSVDPFREPSAKPRREGPSSPPVRSFST
jgi:hypothetical protein